MTDEPRAAGGWENLKAELGRVVKSLEKVGDDEAAASLLRLQALYFLFRRVKNDRLEIASQDQFSELIYRIFQKQFPETVCRMFEFFNVWLELEGSVASGVEVRASVCLDELIRHSGLTRRLFRLPDDDAPVVFATSTYLRSQESEPNGARERYSVAEGEVFASWLLESAVLCAYPNRAVRCLLATPSPHDEWLQDVSGAHVVTLGAADSNPARADVLGRELELVTDGTIRKIEFPLNGEQSEAIVEWFSNPENRRKATEKGVERYIVLRRDPGNGDRENYIYDTHEGMSVDESQARDVLRESRGLSETDRRGTVATLGFVSGRYPSPYDERFLRYSVAGIDTQGTAAATLALADPRSASTLMDGLYKGQPFSRCLVAHTGEAKIPPVWVRFL